MYIDSWGIQRHCPLLALNILSHPKRGDKTLAPNFCSFVILYRPNHCCGPSKTCDSNPTGGMCRCKRNAIIPHPELQNTSAAAGDRASCKPHFKDSPNSVSVRFCILVLRLSLASLSPQAIMQQLTSRPLTEVVRNSTYLTNLNCSGCDTW